MADVTIAGAVMPPSKLITAASVLQLALEHPVITASDIMEATGVTRSTAMRQADDLVARGWLRELPNARAASPEYRKGRPARRYALQESAGALVAVDAGSHEIVVRVCDLRGHELHVLDAPIDPETSATERLRRVDEAVGEALREAGAQGQDVLCMVVAVSAPVDERGVSPRDPGTFWQVMNPGYVDGLAHRARHVLVENDANLAALAEGRDGAGRGRGSYIVLLSGERFGAGYVVDGRLVRGARGAAGELGFLRQIDDVGSTEGVESLARDWILEMRADRTIRPPSPLARGEVGEIRTGTILRAAEDGDEAARLIRDRIVDRLARVCVVLGGLLDVERIVIAGPSAPTIEPLLEATVRRTQEMGAPARIVVSELGPGVVGLGALARALAWLHESALELVAGAAPASASGVPSPAPSAR